MGDWKVWLVAFLGFTAVLAVGVVLIAFNPQRLRCTPSKL